MYTECAECGHLMWNGRGMHYKVEPRRRGGPPWRERATLCPGSVRLHYGKRRLRFGGVMTHTYVILEVSPATYTEIKEKLDAAGYQHAFDGEVIDMHGIALQAEPIVAAMPQADGDDGEVCDLGPRLTPEQAKAARLMKVAFEPAPPDDEGGDPDYGF